MTAINIRVTNERATVWTDGLMYHPDGTIFGLTHKARRLEGWPAVLTSTGLVHAGDQLAAILPTFAASFDDFLADRDALLREALRDVQPAIDRSSFPRFAAFIVGWSQTEGKPLAIVYSDLNGTGAGEISTTTEIISPRLFELEMQEVILSLREETRKTGKKPSLSDAARLTMEVQRRHRSDPEYAPDGFYVGGHITETVIDARGVREKVIHRWNDTVGEKVNPDADYPQNVTPLTGNSRADRRRAAKIDRKKVRAA